MAKTPMREATRESIFEWMSSEYLTKNKDVLAKPREKAVTAINKAIRSKYPEADMIVLRKYSLTRRDGCLKYMNTENQQVSGVEFFGRYDSEDEESYAVLADLPSSSGCRSGDVFPVSPTAFVALEAFTRAKQDDKELRETKFRQYKSLLAACKTVDELNEIVSLPEDLKQRYMTGGALIAINPETIASIKSDFKQNKAA